MEAPKEWKGTAEQWDGVIEAFENLAIAIREAFKPVVKTFQELYSGLRDVTADPELKRLIKKSKAAAVYKGQAAAVGKKLEAAAVGSRK